MFISRLTKEFDKNSAVAFFLTDSAIISSFRFFSNYVATKVQTLAKSNYIKVLLNLQIKPTVTSNQNKFLINFVLLERNFARRFLFELSSKTLDKYSKKQSNFIGVSFISCCLKVVTAALVGKKSRQVFSKLNDLNEMTSSVSSK